MNVPSLNDSDVQSLIDGLKLQIKCFNDGVTNTLSETMAEAKMVLNKRRSDGKTFMISANHPIRSKLKYQLEKAEAIWEAKIRVEAISGNDVPSLNDSDVQSLIDELKIQIKCFNDGVAISHDMRGSTGEKSTNA